MDEIDWINNSKKALIRITKIFMLAGVFFAIFALTNSKNDWEDKKIMVLASLLIATVMPVILVICFVIIYFFAKLFNSGRPVINFDKGYIRELPKHCSPAICSLIYDLKIDVYKDYTATVLYLCIKKYINLIKDGDSYKLEVIDGKDYSNLGICEEYVLDTIRGKYIFDENKFKQNIIIESKLKELMTNKNDEKKYQIAAICIVIILVLYVLFATKDIGLSIVFIVCGVFMVWLGERSVKSYVPVVDTDYKRTKDGKKIAILLGGLKRYIKDYTLIKEKEIEYVKILEDYIPYALALGEADAVEEFVKYHEQYRDLIYNRKSMQ